MLYIKLLSTSAKDDDDDLSFTICRWKQNQRASAAATAKAPSDSLAHHGTEYNPIQAIWGNIYIQRQHSLPLEK